MRFYRLVLIALILFLTLPIVIFASESNTSLKEKTPVDYILPYPGILPDHPFYPLKVFRDKIYDLLLTDPLKKANFKLLMADKRMAMAEVLKDKDKQQLAEVTISKASKYYEEAVTISVTAKQKNRDTNDLQGKLLNAFPKYQEIIINFQKYSTSEVKNGLEGSLTRIIRNGQTAKILK